VCRGWEVRRKLGAKLPILEVVEGELRLKPLREVRLTDLSDSIEVEVGDFKDTHELGRALSREG